MENNKWLCGRSYPLSCTVDLFYANCATTILHLHCSLSLIWLPPVRELVRGLTGAGVGEGVRWCATTVEDMCWPLAVHFLFPHIYTEGLSVMLISIYANAPSQIINMKTCLPFCIFSLFCGLSPLKLKWYYTHTNWFLLVLVYCFR